MTPKSWYVEITTTYESGYKRTHRSSRFGSREDAQRFLEGYTASSQNVTGVVMGSRSLPEIFVHCGKDSQALGAICPGCHKVLTLSDAIAYATT